MAERRIPAKDFWAITDLIETAKATGVEWDRWRKTYVKAHDHFLDEVNFLSGAIVENLPNGSVKVVGRMEQADLDKAWEMTEALTQMDRDIARKVRGLAARFGVFPQDIDIKTGTVAKPDFETIKEPVEEAESPVKKEAD